MDDLIELIRAWAARARLQTGLRLLFLCLTCGIGAALVMSMLSRLFPILSSDAVIGISAVCVLLSLAVAWLYPLIHTARRTPAAWAREFDQKFRLKERLSTALELGAGVVVTNNERMRERQITDAYDVAIRLPIHTLLPLRISMRHLLYALALGLALAITIALPNPQNAVLAQRARAQAIINNQRQEIEDIKQQVAQSTTLTDEQKRSITQALSDVQQALSDPNATPEKTLAAINDAQAKLDALRDQAWPEQRDSLQRTGQSMAPNQLTNPLANALEKGDFKLAAEQMRNLTQQNGQSLNEEQRQRLAEQLEQMARGLQDSSPQTAQQLRDAARKIRAGQTQAAQEDLNKVAETLKQAGEKSASEQQVDAVQEHVEDARRSVSENQQPSSSDAQLDQPQTDAQSQTNAQVQQGSPADSQSAEAGQSSASTEASNDSADSPGSNAGGHKDDVGSDNSIYTPERIKAPGEQVSVESDKGKNAPNPSASSNSGVDTGATVPYQNVYSQYARTADEAIQSGDVPPGLRDYVHDYFSSLDPANSR